MTQFDPEQDDPLSQTWDVFRDMAFGPDEADTPPAIPACLPAYLGNSSLRVGLALGSGRPPANSPRLTYPPRQSATD